MIKFEVIGGNTCLSFGTLGEQTNVAGLCVGDIISYKDSQKNFKMGIILKETKKAQPYYAVMGHFSTKLPEWINGVSDVRVIIPYNLVTPDILNHINGSSSYRYFTEFREVQVRRMTMSQIEKALGYHIEIIEEDK